MILVLMGPAGAGKSTIGRALADDLGWRFVDADSYHAETSVAKMRRGEPLTDADRADWLRTLRDVIADAASSGLNLVLACSALARRHRDALAGGLDGVTFVYLRTPASVLRARLAARPDHFADERLLPQQLATLEEPEEAFTVDATRPPPEIVAIIRRHFGM
ncbi:MAG TPA: gluconokinase, GntK/IdnK-type [Vicinamibacterales bacterium]|nr:gluconokinase, GntK/IdnK-type [Vicinamibacterales bacterium]